ncbi:MAG: trypsin-like peptidase domain-containing protein [Chitinophagaceae bacterium]|nr:trypsin-like peptidase domain-containing protein [Chitinophagaceae bacterium]
MCVSGWESERRAIAQVIDEGGGWCSASLVMNTCNTTKPYILTANHCVEQNGSVINTNNSTFEFLWFSPTCTPTTNTTSTWLFNGATIRARWEQSDFALLELNQTIPQTANLTFLGWSRSTTPPISSVGIHHPMGDIMKISMENSPALIGDVRNFPNTAWRVQWDVGTVQGGSSGSPLFDQTTHRLVGQLFSNTQPASPPCNQQSGGTNYGRFDTSWTGGGTNSTRLSNWLDPTGTNAYTTNTTNVSSLIPTTLQLSINRYCDNGVIQANFPSGSTFYWQVYGDLLIDGTSTTKTTTSNYINVTGTEGSVYVTVTTTCGTQQAGVQYVLYEREITGLYPEYMMGDHVSVSVNTYPYDTYYRWYVNNTLVKEGSDAYTYCTCDFDTPDARVCGDNTIRVEIETTCNITSSVDGDFFKICGYYKMESNVEMFPNPAKNQITVRLKQNNTKEEKVRLKEITQIKILDKTGSVKKIVRYPSNTNTINVDISILPVDIYYVEVSDGRNSERLPLSIVK